MKCILAVLTLTLGMSSIAPLASAGYTPPDANWVNKAFSVGGP